MLFIARMKQPTFSISENNNPKLNTNGLFSSTETTDYQFCFFSEHNKVTDIPCWYLITPKKFILIVLYMSKYLLCGSVAFDAVQRL